MESNATENTLSDSTSIQSVGALPATARLSLGDSASATSTAEHLRFQLDHALARDAVHTPLDTDLLTRSLTERGLQPLLLRSAATNRASYLRRPDLGRTLHPDSIAHLQSPVILSEASRPYRDAQSKSSEGLDPGRVLFVLADGLSALALERHALPLLDATLALVPDTCCLIPVVQNARVAVADQIGDLLGAEITVLLIGERPGLSSPDSLGVYITWQPRPGRTDAERNCISNIRAEGLSYTEAAQRIAHYFREAVRLQTTGITLKDPDSNLLQNPLP
jgi:ethanolamine ammonia-lyase small subunit